ncbi:MAG: DUF1841 family protein [Sphingobacteriia bacterium]|nr:DUF1841 family protein [Sphingobacteriia bacterium]NCC39858.1 DUF1841 family protein [Gammaproteobacteria bacterium]
MFSNDRQSHRRVFITAWEKAQTGQTLAPLEHQIVQVLRQHPEYQAFMRHGDAALERDFHPQQGETNPYLHLSLHLAIQDQLQLDQPAGIRGLYQELLKITGDAHETEHRIMACLAEGIWNLQQDRRPFDESAYLECVRGACN